MFIEIYLILVEDLKANIKDSNKYLVCYRCVPSEFPRAIILKEINLEDIILIRASTIILKLL